MDLFSHRAEILRQQEAPLADRMRPQTLDDFIGQKSIIGPGRLLRRAIEGDRVGSVLLYGPPGTGKTTLARIIANRTSSWFEPLNAVSAGVADIRRVVAEARDRFALHSRRTIVFIDEIHRFNRSQQDALLPAVEDGTIILIGATTENPYFEVNAPLLSRSRIFRLEALKNEDILQLLQRAVTDPEHGYGKLALQIDEEALRHWADSANGDARVALNALELAVLTTQPDTDGLVKISLAEAEESVQRRLIRYDRSGDQHYDVISAFIKSLRGSDPDAAVFWLGRMLAAGEDPRFIARRMVVHAAEDVGMADPAALLVAVAAAQAVDFVGLPEARIPLAQAAIHIATAPKSNAVVLAIDSALEAAGTEQAEPVPIHLRDAAYPGARHLGHGAGYQYPHDFPRGFTKQQYMPGNMKGRRFYLPTNHGREGEIKRRLNELWQHTAEAHSGQHTSAREEKTAGDQEAADRGSGKER